MPLSRCSDFIFFARSAAEAEALCARVLADMRGLGWCVNTSKSQLAPSQRVTYLGYELCSAPSPFMQVPAAKIRKCRESIRYLVSRREQFGADVAFQGATVARLAGVLQSFRQAVGPVPVFTRALYSCLGDLPELVPGTGWRDFKATVALSPAAWAELDFWYRRLPLWNGRAVNPLRVTRVLYTDACRGGWGALLARVRGRQYTAGVLRMSSRWDYIDSIDSVLTELKALWRALVTGVRGGELQGQSVLHRTDSISTYAIVAAGGTCRSSRLNGLARLVWAWCMLHDIQLQSQFVGADTIISSGADALSRSDDLFDCQLRPFLFGLIWQAFGPLGFDRFASYATAQCAPGTTVRLPYNSLFADEGTAGVDALAADWSGCVSYAFPPAPLIAEVLRIVRASRCKCALVAPVWPSQVWWPLLLELSTARLGLGSVHDLCLPNSRGAVPLPGWAADVDTRFAAFFLDGARV